MACSQRTCQRSVVRGRRSDMKVFTCSTERHRDRSLRWGGILNQFCVKTSTKKCKTPRVLHTLSSLNPSTSQHLPNTHLCKTQQFCASERSFGKTVQNRNNTPDTNNPSSYPTLSSNLRPLPPCPARISVEEISCRNSCSLTSSHNRCNEAGSFKSAKP